MYTYRVRPLSLLLLLVTVPFGRAAVPTDNPVATFYSGPEGYPAWTDALPWSRVIDMKTYAKGKTAYEKFEKACQELSEGGGVLYYPAGTYDFTTKKKGRGLMLPPRVIIRGEAPASRALAANGRLQLTTKFVFPFRKRGGGTVPEDWNLIGLQIEHGAPFKEATNQVGIVWIHLKGASIFFGPEVEWGKKPWGEADSPMKDKVKNNGWAKRVPDGTHPFDVLASGSKKYRGAGQGRLVFGCVLEDAALLDDFLDPGYGANGFAPQRFAARITVYGSRILVANNLLPRSRKNFTHRQPTSRNERSLVMYDFGNTCGIDINKELLMFARQGGACPGYFDEGVVVRDNYVFNHGQTGFQVSGNWVTITGNNNDRAFLRAGDRVYPNLGRWTLTVDGWQVSDASADNRARAFDLAGRNLWIDGNRFTNTGSKPGKDGEGIVCRAKDGTPIYSWAITHNTHKRGVGAAGFLGGSDADCHGLLIAWNQTPGEVGNAVEGESTKMTDCAFVANKCLRVVPDKKSADRLGLPAPLTDNPPAPPAPPRKVTALAYQGDAVKITWAAGSSNAIGFRVERRIARGKWQVIAYRPPRIQGDADNPQAWVDFTAPTGKELIYRVLAIDADDTDKAAGPATVAMTLSR